MMTPEQFEAYEKRLPLTHLGRTYLEVARNGKDGEPAAPSRAVESRVGNVIVRYPSLKNHKVLSFESRRIELAIGLLLENDDNVLEYWPQPPQITLEYSSAKRTVCHPYTPDFLILRRDGIQWVEGKPADKMQVLTARIPGRYEKVEELLWRCPPGDVVANAHGFSFRVWTDAEFTRERIRNLKHLDQFLKLGHDHYAETVWRPVYDYVCSHPGISIEELGMAAGVEGPALIRWMLAYRLLFCDLDKHILTEPLRARVYPRAAVAKAMEALRVIEPVWPSVSSDAISTSVVPIALQELTKLLLSRGIDCFEEANRRLAIIQERVPKEQVDACPRSVRRWRHAFRKQGYLGLCGCYNRQGNHLVRVAPELIELRDEYIQNQFLKPPKKTARCVYLMFRSACQARYPEDQYPELVIPSYVWFNSKILALKKGDIAQAQLGNRAAYPFQSNQKSLSGLWDSRGDYPFMDVHVDHTELSIFVASAITGQQLGKPWLTVLIDATCRAVLAVYLSLDKPSRDSLMMILRDCVRRHGRLPFGMVVDNASEFRSVYFETFTGAKGIWVTLRPPHHPKFGNPVENFFGMVEEQFIGVLEGSSHILKTPRIATKSVDPVRRAIWTLGDLSQGIEHFCFDYWNQKTHPDLGKSPAEALKGLVAMHGINQIPGEQFNDEFLIQTMPEVPGGTARVQKPCGIRFRGDYFQNPALAAFIGKNLPARWDPMDPCRIFVQTPDGWVPCFSRFVKEVAGLSARDVQFFAQDLRHRHAATEQDHLRSDTELGGYLRYLKEIQEPELQARRDRARENQGVNSGLSGPAQPVTAEPTAKSAQLALPAAQSAMSPVSQTAPAPPTLRRKAANVL